jgi:putative membrane protein
VSPAPNTTNDTASAVKDTAGHAVGTISAEMTTTLQGFVPAAAVSDMYEVEAAKIAQQRSQNPEIIAFAKKMEKAHTKTTAKLKTILSTMNSPVAPPAHLDDRRQGMIDELRGAKAADFDGRYMSQQIDAHKEALILMQGYAKNGDAAAVKEFAAKTAPIVQSHLNMAEHIYNKLPK